MKISKQQYLKNPCGESSLPYWKMLQTTVPEHMLILHDRNFRADYLTDYTDEPYFRLFHDLKKLQTAILPDGFFSCDASPAEYAAHINQCYPGAAITEAEIISYFQNYASPMANNRNDICINPDNEESSLSGNPSGNDTAAKNGRQNQHNTLIQGMADDTVAEPAELWIAVREWKSQKIVATGIAGFDEQAGEGILEWIQVSPTHRRTGLGSYIVTELLNRIAKKAQFATVSGQRNNPSNPERLYRRCGFQGNDVWHVLKKKEIDIEKHQA